MLTDGRFHTLFFMRELTFTEPMECVRLPAEKLARDTRSA